MTKITEANPAPKPLRLHVYIAHAGAASRRQAEQCILEGRVTVNGQVVNVLGAKVGAGDRVCLDNKPLIIEETKHYILLNKPPGYICAAADPQGRPLAGELLPRNITERLYTIGRLDFRSSGLLIFTNDGDFAAKIGHPRAELEKEYMVEATGAIRDGTIKAFLAGLNIDGILYKAREIERVGWKTLRIVLIEGKNREIRRVFSFFHLHPLRLERTRIGPVKIADLREGQSRPLTQEELLALRSTEQLSVKAP
ncbi:pseudouridine synthase [Breznakiellaceae bacterium SP9]